MDFNIYLNKYVMIDIDGGLYYKGKIIDVSSKNLTLIDKNNSYVTIRFDLIKSIRDYSKIKSQETQVSDV